MNKNSQEKELAVEFLRFLMTPERLDSMAAIKGMPSAAVDGRGFPPGGYVQPGQMK